MSNVFFTSDQHFGHKNIIEYCNRPFADVEEMNRTMISLWNGVVRPEDLVYHLGDFCLDRGNVNSLLNILNGTIFFLWGSHDKWMRHFAPDNNESRVIFLGSLDEIIIEKQPIILCHYSMRSWPKSFHGSWHLFGHSHGRLEPYGKSFDVGVDYWNFTPVSWEQVKNKMNELERNKD
jgi:calcineurin-like phosphoesterase family protein